KTGTLHLEKTYRWANVLTRSFAQICSTPSTTRSGHRWIPPSTTRCPVSSLGKSPEDGRDASSNLRPKLCSRGAVAGWGKLLQNRACKSLFSAARTSPGPYAVDRFNRHYGTSFLELRFQDNAPGSILKPLDPLDQQARRGSSYLVARLVYRSQRRAGVFA